METKTKNQEKVAKIIRMDYVSKSDVMKRAWRMFKDENRPAFLNCNGNYYSLKDFAGCLSAAWGMEKDSLAYRTREAEKAAERAAEQARLNEWWASAEYKSLGEKMYQPTAEVMESYYRSGVYSGD